MDANDFDATYKAKNVIAEFQNELGETRIVHRPKGRNVGSLRILKQSDSASHRLNRAAAVLIGARIKAARLSRGMTLEQLGERAGLKGNPVKVYMFSIEKAARREGIRFGTLYAIALALDCSIDELMPPTKEVRQAANVDFRESVTLA